MDHLEAKEMHAAEKYVLGELSEELREQYEEHYLDCSECAVDVRSAVAFVANSRELFLDEKQLVPAARETKHKWRGWAGWLKPLIAVPAMAALVFALVYERHHTGTLAPASDIAQQTIVASNSFRLRGGDRQADQSVNVQVHAQEAFALLFDFTPGQNFAKYTGELQDSAGRALRQFAISAERINKEVKLVVPGQFTAPGNYALVVYGAPQGAESTDKIVVAKYAFTVEIIP